MLWVSTPYVEHLFSHFYALDLDQAVSKSQVSIFAKNNFGKLLQEASSANADWLTEMSIGQQCLQDTSHRLYCFADITFRLEIV